MNRCIFALLNSHMSFISILLSENYQKIVNFGGLLLGSSAFN